MKGAIRLSLANSTQIVFAHVCISYPRAGEPSSGLYPARCPANSKTVAASNVLSRDVGTLMRAHMRMKDEELQRSIVYGKGTRTGSRLTGAKPQGCEVYFGPPTPAPY